MTVRHRIAAQMNAVIARLLHVINIQLRNTDNIRTDLYILLKPQSELGYLGSNLICININLRCIFKITSSIGP